MKMFNTNTDIHDDVVQQLMLKESRLKGYADQGKALGLEGPYTFNHEMTLYDMVLMEQDSIAQYSKGATEKMVGNWNTVLPKGNSFVENLMFLNQLTKKTTRNYNPADEVFLGGNKEDYMNLLENAPNDEVKKQMIEITLNNDRPLNKEIHRDKVERFKSSKNLFLEQVNELYGANDIDLDYPRNGNTDINHVKLNKELPDILFDPNPEEVELDEQTKEELNDELYKVEYETPIKKIQELIPNDIKEEEVGDETPIKQKEDDVDDNEDEEQYEELKFESETMIEIDEAMNKLDIKSPIKTGFNYTTPIKQVIVPTEDIKPPDSELSLMKTMDNPKRPLDGVWKLFGW